MGSGHSSSASLAAGAAARPCGESPTRARTTKPEVRHFAWRPARAPPTGAPPRPAVPAAVASGGVLFRVPGGLPAKNASKYVILLRFRLPSLARRLGVGGGSARLRETRNPGDATQQNPYILLTFLAPGAPPFWGLPRRGRPRRGARAPQSRVVRCVGVLRPAGRACGAVAPYSPSLRSGHKTRLDTLSLLWYIEGNGIFHLHLSSWSPGLRPGGFCYLLHGIIGH